MLLSAIPAVAQVDSDVIRLGRPTHAQDTEATPQDSPFGEARRGFDYAAFDARLETLWFQRKALLGDGRHADAVQQAERIRAFCAEEGVRRLERVSGALLIEARRRFDEGHYQRAIEALDLAETLDPGRPEVMAARARVHRKSGRGLLSSLAMTTKAHGRALARQLEDLELVHQLLVALIIATLGCVAVFSLIMLLRYQQALRHEVEEWLAARGREHWSLPLGLGLLLLPFLSWIGAGWAALYWILITFRYQRRPERLASAVLVVLTVLAVPAYRTAVAVYGVAADPVVRTTLASADGGYDPGRIVQLRQLVDNYPEDPTYRFLLASQYKAGRYYEEAFDEYRAALELRPSLHQAHINIGNIYHRLGQHAEAIRNYREALAVKSDSVPAHVNLHLAQQASFHFEEAEQTLALARGIDAGRVSELLDRTPAAEDGALPVIDASIQLRSIWQAALAGGKFRNRLDFTERDTSRGKLLNEFANPVSFVAIATLALMAVVSVVGTGGQLARRCTRCGRPFCGRCKADRDSHEYCSQCHHLFVLGEGLAPETKTRKLYEVERNERRAAITRRLASLFLPGSAQVLAGRTLIGCAALIGWIAAWVVWQPAVLRPLERWAEIGPRIELMGGGSVPAVFIVQPFTVLALGFGLLLWLALNLRGLRRREG